MDIKRTDLAKSRRRRWTILSAAGAALAIVVVAVASTLNAAAFKVDRANLWLDTVKRGEMLREVRGPGLLVPKEIRWIAAETPARVERMLLKPGAAVQPNDVILELSNPEVVEAQLLAHSELVAVEADMAAERATRQNQLLDQKAKLADVQSQYELARMQTEAETELAVTGIVSKLQYRRNQVAAEQLKLMVGIEKERVARFIQTMRTQQSAQDARMEQLRNTADLRTRQLEALKVRAGIAGVLQQVPVEEGQQVIAGANLARVARPDVLMAELRIPETQITDVREGQEVSVDTRNGIVLGRVIRLDPAVQTGTVLVDVELTGRLPPSARPDLSVDGTIRIERLPDVLYVGRPAYAQPNSESRLFKVDPSTGIAQRVSVHFGRASMTLIEVKDGLQPGDQVVVSDTSQWDKHDRLRID
ncbi:efflux RND transporter periplasmic adaptor subunit [Xanthomonas pisi]|uniref:RND transporter n=1 Tax=Xanthomonas pisi TaxID=56457 RepID=A0A2S7D603_9XANT|nr:HlyD family efflux transporter periplasmic adaptor subunit [Xanthomonas pisi]KLD69875.1 RND transporter [Xanthomonas pisi DSM 18956]PPU69189.1 RND transporter [Xanthomonas pisi]